MEVAMVERNAVDQFERLMEISAYHVWTDTVQARPVQLQTLIKEWVELEVSKPQVSLSVLL